MKVVYPSLPVGVVAHPPGEFHQWAQPWGRTWQCLTCGCIINRITGQVLREGAK